MPASSKKLHGEGAQIPSIFLVEDGIFSEEEISGFTLEQTGAYL
jgi:N-methylhydantoinase B/oxoprolinase/acetone carboxylase alpha subunit